MSDIIRDARQRIMKVRQKDVEILVLQDGKPVDNAAVSVRMTNHQYLFGAVCYQYGKYNTKEMNDLFTEEFVKLFNYTMVPYHWSWYEPRRHAYNEPYTSNLIKWAKEHHLKKKLHALIWHELVPDWVSYDDDIKELYTQRISRLMTLHGNDFEFFDVANETTVNDRFDTPVSRWVRTYGPMNMIRFGTKLVRSFKPEAKLLYGDWNVHADEYYDFLREMRENNIDIDILGMQSHMHKERWGYQQTLDTIDRAAAFGWPIHFPECSIMSGVPARPINYQSSTGNLFTETEEDLYSQAAYARDFYTLVFSHPATEALSWFDFTDHRWLGAPAGVVTEDLKIKPVYNTLHDLIHREWHTDADLKTGSNGVCGARLFFGSYDITIDYHGRKTTMKRDILRESFYAGSDDAQVIKIEIP